MLCRSDWRTFILITEDINCIVVCGSCSGSSRKPNDTDNDSAEHWLVVSFLQRAANEAIGIQWLQDIQFGVYALMMASGKTLLLEIIFAHSWHTRESGHKWDIDSTYFNISYVHFIPIIVFTLLSVNHFLSLQSSSFSVRCCSSTHSIYGNCYLLDSM